MLTLKELKGMESGAIFLSGMSVDGPEGINMDRSGKMLHWVAVRGGIHDWAIYCGLEDWSKELVASNGNKVTDEQTIKRLVPCDNEAFKMYRY